MQAILQAVEQVMRTSIVVVGWLNIFFCNSAAAAVYFLILTKSMARKTAVA